MQRTWFKELRENKGLTQKELALIVDISPNYLCEIERGHKNPSGIVASRLAEALKFDMSLFYTQIGRESNTRTA
ncbi:helix-turn-helix domain-containing protein [Kroppenstedtia eburnea]|uniref:DNA-binding transcriptional regulator, XRE-family HTH domain n=1 Tax=Kroppenstedtia eburnea TaxID=714067 RepID=A0A1N7JGT2_9BACL|nr:helix-turn-helix transcriptional regulator [Kroppenstedtia eburnea]QKI80558.1 helix-turn-helix transcriptional regulator [Kroppenstedtia eburnea]SIS48461.1 DNA-binding transcriptional regulator, XRE-family HTH domain [Kroppenstedtia eburnea]